MNKFTVGNIFIKKKLKASRPLRFLAIFVLGFVVSLVPLGLCSFTLGFPLILLNSILIFLFLDKENSDLEKAHAIIKYYQNALDPAKKSGLMEPINSNEWQPLGTTADEYMKSLKK